MLVHISCDSQFPTPKHLLSHSSNLSICTHMVNTNIEVIQLDFKTIPTTLFVVSPKYINRLWAPKTQEVLL